MRFVKTIRFRLTIWYLVILVALLLLFGMMSYFMLSQSLYQGLDDSLRARVLALENSLEVEDGHIDLGITLQPSELVLLYGNDGSLLQGFGWGVEVPHIDTLVAQARGSHTSFLTARIANGDEIRLYVAPLSGESEIGAIVVGRSTATVTEVLESFNNILIVAVLATLALAGGGGFFMANRVLKPVERIRQTAQEIGESDLSRRIAINTEDELGRLASTLNHMIARLEAAFNRQRQFTADASHELRTPLAIVQAESTLALRKERTQEDYRKSLELISQEAGHMSAVVGKSLYLARIDAGKDQVNFERINLRELLAGLSSDIELLAREKGLEFKIAPLEDLTVEGDKIKLAQLFLNLLENAIRYTPKGGSISVSVVREDKTAVIAIKDTGIGISKEHIPHLFERFYRVDKARSRAEGGAGLGLAICKHIAQVHNGKIEVESQVGKGSTFSISLPLTENSDSDNHERK
jgi:heavy metal sensor kinase